MPPELGPRTPETVLWQNIGDRKVTGKLLKDRTKFVRAFGDIRAIDIRPICSECGSDRGRIVRLMVPDDWADDLELIEGSTVIETFVMDDEPTRIIQATTDGKTTNVECAA